MDIAARLQKAYSKGDIAAVAAYAIENKQHFKQLMQLYLGEDARLAQMASWCLSHAVESNDSFVYDWLPKIVEQLPRKDVHPAVIRNAVRILQDVNIPESLHGAVINDCFTLLQTPNTTAAIKAFSMTVLYNMTKIYTDLQVELVAAIENNFDEETPAFKSRGRKILQGLKKYR